MGVEPLDAVARRVELRAADVGGAVDDLPLQVGGIDHVEVHDAEPADAGGSEVQAQRRAEATGPDHEHARGLELALRLEPELRQDQVTAVAEDLVVAQLRQRLRGD